MTRRIPFLFASALTLTICLNLVHAADADKAPPAPKPVEKRKPVDHLALARKFEDAGNLERAALEYSIARKHLKSAELYEKTGRSKKAKSELTRAANEAEEADDLEKALELHFKAGNHASAATLVRKQGDWRRAAKIFEEQAKLPRRAAGILSFHGDHENAARLYQTLNDPDKRKQELSAAARSHQKSKNFPKALELAKQADDTELLAIIHRDAGEPARSAALFEKAGIHDQAAREWEKAKEFIKAADAHAKAGNKGAAKQALGAGGLHFLHDDPAKAAEFFLKADNPGMAGRAFAKSGEMEKAREQFEKAGDLDQLAFITRRPSASLERTDLERIAELYSAKGRHDLAARRHILDKNFDQAAESLAKIADPSLQVLMMMALIASHNDDQPARKELMAKALLKSGNEAANRADILKQVLLAGAETNDPKWLAKTLAATIAATPAVPENAPWTARLLAERDKILLLHPELEEAK